MIRRQGKKIWAAVLSTSMLLGMCQTPVSAQEIPEIMKSAQAEEPSEISDALDELASVREKENPADDFIPENTENNALLSASSNQEIQEETQKDLSQEVEQQEDVSQELFLQEDFLQENGSQDYADETVRAFSDSSQGWEEFGEDQQCSLELNGEYLLFEDEKATLYLNILDTTNSVNLSDPDFTLKWYVGKGFWSEDRDCYDEQLESEIYSISEDKKSITFDGSIWKKLCEEESDYSEICVRLSYQGNLMAEVIDQVSFRTYQYKLHQNAVEKLLPGQDFYFAKEQQMFIQNHEYPDGDYHDITFTDLEAVVTEGNPDNLEIKEDDNGGWIVRMETEGTIQVTPVCDLNEVPDPHMFSFEIRVKTGIYVSMCINSSLEEGALNPGEQMVLEVDPAGEYYREYSREGIDISGYQVRWSIDRGEQFLSIENIAETDRKILVRAVETFPAGFVGDDALIIADLYDENGLKVAQDAYWFSLVNSEERALYELSLDSLAGTDRVLPNSEIILEAKPSLRIVDLTYQDFGIRGDTSPLNVQWHVSQGDSFISLEQYPDTDRRIKVKAVGDYPETMDENWEEYAEISAVLCDSLGNELAQQTYPIYVTGAFRKLILTDAKTGEIVNLNQLKLGESVRVKPIIKQYFSKRVDTDLSEDGEDITKQYQFSWADDEEGNENRRNSEVLQVLDSQGRDIDTLSWEESRNEREFTVIRGSVARSYYNIYAKKKEENGEWSELISYEGKVAPILYGTCIRLDSESLRGEAETWVYDDETVTIRLESVDPEKPVEYPVYHWKTRNGTYDELSGFLDSVCQVSEDGTSITIDGHAWKETLENAVYGEAVVLEAEILEDTSENSEKIGKN